ncbi:MAG: hypothetical protein QME73_13190 [Bacillota bacterium]|nr:hypothetical protein [Bacillota bacterium]
MKIITKRRGNALDYLDHMRRDPFAGIRRDAEALNILFDRIPGEYYYYHLRHRCPPVDMYETGGKKKEKNEIKRNKQY